MWPVGSAWKEPAVDLGIAVAVASSDQNRSIDPYCARNPERSCPERSGCAGHRPAPAGAGSIGTSQEMHYPELMPQAVSP